MTSGPPPNLQRPWEVESRAPPHVLTKTAAAAATLHIQQDARSYGQDISGWHYNPFHEARQPWDSASASEQPASHGIQAKRKRLHFERDDPYARSHQAEGFKSNPEPPRLGARDGSRSQTAAAALGPVLSLGYMPTMPPSPVDNHDLPEYGSGIRALPLPPPPVPLLPSPRSLSVSSLSGTSSGGTALLPPVTSPSSTHSGPLPPVTARITPRTAGSATRSDDVPHAENDAAVNDLRRLYDSLVKEHDRAKIRLATYDRKSKTADEELVMLHEEKLTLQDRVTALEQELEETREQKRDIQDQHIKEGAQWRQIVSLSNALQKQHTEEIEKWREERGEMSGRIESLEDQVRRLKIASASASADGGSQGGCDNEAVDSGRDGGLIEGGFFTQEMQRIRVQDEQHKQRLRTYQQGRRELTDLLAKFRGVVERLESNDKLELVNAIGLSRYGESEPAADIETQEQCRRQDQGESPEQDQEASV